jgi:hypothetical protein
MDVFFLPEMFLPGIFLPGIRLGKYRYEIFSPGIFSKSQVFQVVCMLLLLQLLHVRACLSIDEPACMNLHA